MKTKFLLPVLLSATLLGACKKGENAIPEPNTPTTTTPTNETPTEGTITITGVANNSLKYDATTITVKSFDLDKSLIYITPQYQQITLQSKDKDGVLFKYNVGLNMPLTTDKVGVKQSCIGGTTPLVGLNVYEGGKLYPYSCMNGNFTIEAMDAHNITILFTGIDFKQSFDQGFDASLKKFAVKSFRVKGTY